MASVRNWNRTSRSRAPTAMRRPISRMRSVTDTSMMFMMPMPPTSREMPAMLPSSTVIICVAWAAVSAISDMLRTVKSSSAPGAMRCRLRRSSWIWATASDMASVETARTSTDWM